jgi:hypothetical protein
VCEVSDAGIIYDQVTGYTFVIRSGYSDRRMISLAVEIMEGFGATLSGFILNDIDIKSGDYYKNKYYSGYSKYRFRYGKSGYYRHFKYGYYKGYYSRYGYSRYSRYGSYGSSYGGTSYAASRYSQAHDAAIAADETLADVEDTEVLTPETEIMEAAPETAVVEETVETVETAETEEVIETEEVEDTHDSFRDSETAD